MTESISRHEQDDRPQPHEYAEAIGHVSLMGVSVDSARVTQSTDPFGPRYSDPHAEHSYDQHPIPQDRHDVAEDFLEDEIRRGIDFKAEEAMERSEFVATSELRNGLRSFYESHYAMAGVIEMGMQDISDPDVAARQQPSLENIVKSSIHTGSALAERIQSLAEHGGNYTDPSNAYVEDTLPLLASVRLARLQHPDDKRLERAEITAQLMAVQNLFAEVSVGTTTVGPQEIDTINKLHSAVTKRIESSGLFEQTDAYGQPVYIPKDLQAEGSRWQIKDRIAERGSTANIESAQAMFWQDTRHAGQLLYHNSSNFRSLWRQGAIRTRRVQLAQSGKLAELTTDVHSNSYGDERHHHSPTVHFSEQFDPQGYRGRAGSLDAGTLAMPMAEVIKTTPFARNAEYGTVQLKPGSHVKEMVALHDTLGNIGWGSNDTQGSSSNDRTFYRSPYDTAPDAPLEQAPDGYEYTFAGTPMLRIALGDQERENIETRAWGTGENVPTTRIIEADPKHLLDEESKIEQQLKTLQQQVLEQYPDQLIVPLRSGIMNFYVPDDGRYNGRPKSRFTEVVGTAPDAPS